MNNRIQNLIVHIGMLLSDGKISGDDAYALMMEVARVGGDLAAEEYRAFAQETYAQRDKKHE